MKVPSCEAWLGIFKWHFREEKYAGSVYSGVSVKFLIVGETNSMVGYHLMAEVQSI